VLSKLNINSEETDGDTNSSEGGGGHEKIPPTNKQNGFPLNSYYQV